MSGLGEMNPSDTPSAPPAPLPTERAVEHLLVCQTLASRFVQEHFDSFYRVLCERLIAASERASSNAERSGYFEIERQLRQLKEAIFERYSLGVATGFDQFKHKSLNTRTGEEKFSGDMLSLVDNEDLEETIAISSITTRAESDCADILWAVNQRLALLNDGGRVNDRSNPLGPIQFCEALRQVLAMLAVSTRDKILAYKALDETLVHHLHDLLDNVNHYLTEQGILPNLQPRPVKSAEGESAAKIETPATNNQAAPVTAAEVEGNTEVEPPAPARCSGEHQANLLSAIKGLQSHLGQSVSLSSTSYSAQSSSTETVSNGSPSADFAHTTTVSNEQIMAALHAIQWQVQVSTAHALQQGNTPEVVPATQLSQQLAGQLQRANGSDDVDASDMHTIDLVGMLFDYMLSDDNLPSSIKALLSYLHTPFLKIAFIDKSFFEEAEHPARLLLNQMAEAGARWVNGDGSSQYDMYDRIKHTVSRVLEEFENDVRIFAELLLDFSGYVKKIARRQDLLEKRAMEKAQGEEQLREVKLQVNQAVRHRIDNRELPSAILLLLLQPWSDYLAFLLLRYGEGSDSWRRALASIDDLLWSIEPKNSNADRARQMEMHDDLLDMLETGFETIGYDQSKGKKLLEAVFSLQKLALQSKRIEPAPAPMRSRLESMAAEKAGNSKASNESDITPEEKRMVEHLKMIEFGTWFDFKDAKRLKVAWYNSKTLHYMMVDQMGKKVAMKSGLELARDMLQGRAKIIAGSTKPFFERALESIFHSLNAKIEHSADENGDAV